MNKGKAKYIELKITELENINYNSKNNWQEIRNLNIGFESHQRNKDVLKFKKEDRSLASFSK